LPPREQGEERRKATKPADQKKKVNGKNSPRKKAALMSQGKVVHGYGGKSKGKGTAKEKGVGHQRKRGRKDNCQPQKGKRAIAGGGEGGSPPAKRSVLKKKK